MKVKTQHCLIRLGPMTIVPKCVWDWEAAVLEEKFGGQCEFTKKGEREISDLPDAGGEYSRLQDAHGTDEETNTSHVANTFGRGRLGIAALEKAMKSSVIKAKTAKKKTSAKKPGPKPVIEKPENDSDDPLS